jgi:hypothetical protein
MKGGGIGRALVPPLIKKKVVKKIFYIGPPIKKKKKKKKRTKAGPPCKACLGLRLRGLKVFLTLKKSV